MIYSKWRPRLLLTTLGVAFSALGGAQQTAPVYFYTMGPTQLNANQVDPVATDFGFQQERSVTGAPLPIWAMADGSVRQLFTKGTFEVIPDLRSEKGAAPSSDVTLRFTEAFLTKYHLRPDDASSWKPSEFSLWSNMPASQKGHGNITTPITSVRYQRLLGGLPVYGPNSIMTFDCDSHGLIGLLYNVRPATVSQLPAVQKKPDQIEGEFRMRLQTDLQLNPGSAKLISKTLCYLDQGVTFIEPAYRYRVEIKGSRGETTGEEIFVPLCTNSPEPILENRFNGFDPIIPEGSPKPKGSANANNVRLGEYVVRQDSDQGICLTIVNNFFGNSSYGASLIGRSVSRTQYYWDEPWLWASALGIPDNSQYYPGAVDFAAVVGHAAPWWFSCLSNFGEFTDIHNFDHYGADSPGGNPSHDYTSYMLFAACSFMPAPGDPYGGTYTSGGPFDVYWNIFHGMHGMYGYRTTAGKQAAVDSFTSFGSACGVACPLVGSWLHSTAALDHGGNWNYGTAVIPSGRESDTMFNLEPLPASNYLTMWWNHA